MVTQICLACKGTSIIIVIMQLAQWTPFIFFLEIEGGTNKNAVFEGSEALPHLHVGTETVFKENNVITSGGSRFLQGGFKIHERACSMHEIFTATPLFNETTPF